MHRPLPPRDREKEGGKRTTEKKSRKKKKKNAYGNTKTTIEKIV
jgi:hypothetical protein